MDVKQIHNHCIKRLLTLPSHTKLTQKPIGNFSADGSMLIANLESKINADELSKYYAQQLQSAGWDKISDGVNLWTNWSIWDFEDEDNILWQGLMKFKAIEGKPNQYSASLSVIKKEYEETPKKSKKVCKLSSRLITIVSAIFLNYESWAFAALGRLFFLFHLEKNSGYLIHNNPT